ncbi:flagellar protein FlaG [Tindallia californiensis]|uniref:Flagellar protein FlaG n=1 Tax=Tindallia californiensis TaxID=159292 RepID=A0A1H3L9Z4_9FIRM|nr:flagellar protein FlaG [Tindallia californiensis]SDY61106.1 flagellar protein FlaG [Tindallia californiensis]
MKIDGIATDRVQSAQMAERVQLRQGSQGSVAETENNEKRRENRVTQQERMEKQMEKGDRVENLQDALDQANKSFEPLNRHFEFSSHDKLNRVMVKVINTKTDEVIREIPPEKLVDMVANMLEVAGILVDERG